MVESQVKLQFNPLNGDLWFNFNVEKLSAEQLQEIKTLVGEYWWADNDELAFLTVYRNGDFMCERRKKAWSHRTGTYSFTAYKWTEPTQAQVAELADKLMKKFEELRLVRLQAEADRISGILSQEYNGLISSFRGMRTRMLLDSDWTQLADSPLSDADKSLYRAYRQHLRDMTDDPAWLANDVFNVDFPITPKTYLQNDPNRETEYLSVDAHFENQAAMKAKFKMMRVYKYLNLPGLFMSEEEYNARSYDDLKDELNRYLKKVNSDLEFNIQFKLKDADRPADYGEVTGQETGTTIDQINNPAE